MVKPRLILGVGNILLRDEGLGVRAVEAMGAMDLGDDVELLDGGTGGADLVELIADREKVVIVDAVDAGVEPGRLLRMDIADLADEGLSISLHEVAVHQAFSMARRLGCAPAEAVVWGMQPADVSIGLDLSSQVASAMDELIARVREEIRK